MNIDELLEEAWLDWISNDPNPAMKKTLEAIKQIKNRVNELAECKNQELQRITDCKNVSMFDLL